MNCAGVQSWILEWMAAQHVPGLSLAVIEKGEVAWRQGLGVRDAATGEPVTEETVFSAASLSKPLFAYVVLKLCEAGVLALDTPLSNYLPEPYLPDEPRLALVTARHVLSHTAGLPNWRGEGQPLRVHFCPGERFAYSGEGIVYLQRVVEHLLGEPLEAVMQERLLKPLGMRQSSYVWQASYEHVAAPGHSAGGERAQMWRPDEANAAYSLHSTPAELARFLLAILQPPEPDGVFLRRETIREMLTPCVAVNDQGLWYGEPPPGPIKTHPEVSWGLGWGLERQEGGEGFWHWGDNGHWHAFALGLPARQAGLVVMTNGENGKGLWRQLVGATLGGEHPALDWLESLYRMLYEG